jgi:hypothetical protein
MAQSAKEVIIVPSQTIIATGNSPAVVVPVDYVSAILYFNVGSAAGTTETMNMVIQQGFRAPAVADNFAGAGLSATTPTIWDDYISFAQVTTSSGVQVARIFASTGTSAANGPTASIGAASATGGLTAGTVKPGPLGMWWRAIWTVAGTSPSYGTVYVTAQFINQQS